MKVLLRQDIEQIGARGEIIEVAPGFARNYLLPRQLAVLATAENFRQLENEKARIVKQAAREHAELEAARARLEAVSCTLVAAASPEGHLYGSIGPREIAEALAKEGFPIEEKHVRLEEHFKEIGVYVVDTELAPGLTAKTRVWIVAQ